MTRRPFMTLIAATLLGGCSDHASGPADPEPLPTGSAPDVFLTLAFGDAPVEGQIQLVPAGASTEWSYTVEFDANGPLDRSGTLRRGIGFFYSFDEVGIHPIIVTVERGAERFEIERFVVVNDPAGTRVVAQQQLPRDLTFGSNFEGLAVDRAGTTVYAADFSASLLYAAGADDLRLLRPPLVVPTGPEGLSVSPSDSLLFIVHKRGPLLKLALPGLETRGESPGRGFFIHALDDRRVLVGGDSGDVELIDTDEASTIATGPGTWHFSVADDRLAVLDFLPPLSVRILGIPALDEQHRIILPEGFRADAVAFDPDGSALYVLGRQAGAREGHQRFLTYEMGSGRILRDMTVESSGCFSFNCAANLVATSMSGRYIAFEQTSGILIVDTTVDLPMYRSSAGGSVAASSVEEAFYALRTDGLLSKIVVGP